MNLQKRGKLAHGFYPGTQQICGDIHFDKENWTDKKAQSGDGKHNIFSVGVHELGHALEIFHSNEEDSIMVSYYKHGFSTDDKNETLSDSDKALIRQEYGKPKIVVHSSKKQKSCSNTLNPKRQDYFYCESEHFAGLLT